MTEERLREAEYRWTHGRYDCDDLKQVFDEVRRLREALRFYADDQHWHTHIVVADGTYPGRELPAPGSRRITARGGEIVTVTAIDQDHGKRARQALEAEE